MKTRDLKSLSETIASVVDPIDKERAQMLQEGFLNSLTEKARQVVSEAVETKTEDEAEAIMKRLAAKALKKAKKKARASTDDAYAGINPSAAKTDPDMKNTGAVAEELIYEVAAPGYEDWASDPKVKASFKKQYGKRWQEVMYGHSWNLAKQEKKVGLGEETLDEAVSAKRMRIIRKYVKGNNRVPERLKDYMERSFKKKRFKDKQLSDGRGAVGALETRMRRKSAALRARGIEPKGVAPGYLEEELQLDELTDTLLFRARAKAKAFRKFKVRKNSSFAGSSKDVPLHKKITQELQRRGSVPVTESMQLDEAGYKRLGRIKGAAYKAELASRGADPNTSLEGLVKATKLKRAAAEKTAKVAAGMARRGGATPETVKNAGSRLSKKGKYTLKAGKLATQYDKAMRSFRSMSGVKELTGRGEDKSEKRARQQAQAAFVKKARSGDFGQDNQAAIRARSNFQKRYGRLKGK